MVITWCQNPHLVHWKLKREPGHELNVPVLAERKTQIIVVTKLEHLLCAR